MFQSIPASQIVSVNPSVLSAGGSPLSMNGVFLSENTNLPTGQAVSFATADSVGEYFGFTSKEYQAAAIYFKGFDGSSIKPSTMIFFAYNKETEGAFLLGSSLKSMSLTALKKIIGSISIVIDGEEKSSESIDLSTVKSFSNAAELISSLLGGVTVTFDTQLQAFKMASSTTGTASTIAFATGTIADALGLTENAGAVISQGSNTATPTETMQSVTNATLNWATFTTITEPTLEEKLEFAKWSNDQNQRFLYVGWGFEGAATQSGNTTSFGAQLKGSEYNGATAIYGGLDKAAFLCGTVASINFTEKQGRITVKFKGQSGLTPDVTDATIAKNLEENGYNYYGAWATANDRFLFMSPGQLSGKWKWIDSFVNQIRINSQLQLALITLLMNSKSIPYNETGIALQRAACTDPINEALNFGSIQTGINLSEQQKSIVNNVTGIDAATQIEINGYYLYIGRPSAQTRGNRESFPMSLYYTDGGSLHSVNLASINIQ